MGKKKACKSCKLFYDENECPQCHSSQSALNWRGRLSILDSQKSEIAKKIGVTTSGEYAIKVT